MTVRERLGFEKTEVVLVELRFCSRRHGSVVRTQMTVFETGDGVIRRIIDYW